MTNVLRLVDQKGAFLTRSQGEKLRHRIEEIFSNLESGHRIAIDFAGVDVMTPSFADECFGKLAERLGANRFRQSISLNGADETIRTLINSVLAERLSTARHRPE